jgi:cell division protein FtsI (penicillin-binding protein 3)
MKVVEERLPAWRAYVVALVLALLTLALIARVLSLQLLDSERGASFLQKQGSARIVRTTEIPATRGMITDRRGEPLAVSTPVISLWINPSQFYAAERSGAERMPELAAALGRDVDGLSALLEKNRHKQFLYLQRNMIPADARVILDQRFPGVAGQRDYRRFYPAGEITAQLVGMTNIDDRGIEGLELAFDHVLAGVPGRKQFIRHSRGNAAVRDIGELQAAQPGQDLHLSIDLRLQHALFEVLRETVTRLDASSATVVTLDSRTGEVLAMVTYPSYNPNRRGSSTGGHSRNRALTDMIEPGSTIKPFTLAAALETGRYHLDTPIETSPGRIRVGPKVLPDPVNYGTLTVDQVLAKSSQVGITKIALDMGHEPLWSLLQRVGFGVDAGTGFPGESMGLLPVRHRWRPIEQATLAFGYGLTITPLQLARAYTIFANDGVLRPASLLRVDGEVLGETVLAPEIARSLLGSLQRVTTNYGTGSRARVPGYSVAGKTGTVHKVGMGGYSANRYMALFAGIAPADAPRIVTVVMVDEPKGALYQGGTVAAPLFSASVREALRLLHISPQAEAVAAAALRKGRGV